MAEWILEEGIGENRAALVADGAILQAEIERDDGALRAGAIMPARFDRWLVPGRRGLATPEDGTELLVEPAAGLPSEGATFLALVEREAIAEAGAVKRARVRVAPPGASPCPAPGLVARLNAGAYPVRRLLSHEPDALEAAGWSELIDESARCAVDFAGGSLRLSLTPAMVLIDVDGFLPPAALALAGAKAAAHAIRRMGLAGSIGIDLPTVGDKAVRAATAAAVDAILPQPFERTAVNGFGFLQIVRRRVRASLPELIRAAPAESAALGLLRQAERSRGGSPVVLVCVPPVAELIARRPEWLAMLGRRTGAEIVLQADATRPIWDSDAKRPSI